MMTVDAQDAIEKLKANKKICAKYNFFGRDNHRSIDVMIDVIEHNRSEEFIYTTYQSHFDDGRENTEGHADWSVAMVALEFMRGKYNIADILYPE